MNSNNLFFSVIIPVFNTGKYLRECLDSVIHQSYNSWEIIIVEDCSTDNSLQIAEEYQKQYPNIKLIRHNKNQGLGAARNNGIKHATGKYIVFLDSDDWMKNNSLQDLYLVFKNNSGLDVAFMKIAFVSEDNQIISYSQFVEKGMHKMSDQLKININPGAWNKCYRLEFIKNNNLKFAENKLVFEDISFFLAWSSLVKEIYVLKDHYIMYRQRTNSLSKSADQKILDIFKVFELGKEEMMRLKTFETERDFFCAAFLFHVYFVQFDKIKNQGQSFILKFRYYRKMRQEVCRFNTSEAYMNNLNPALKKAYIKIKESILWIICIKFFIELIVDKIKILKNKIRRNEQ